MKKLIFEIVT